MLKNQYILILIIPNNIERIFKRSLNFVWAIACVIYITYQQDTCALVVTGWTAESTRKGF